MIHLTALSMYRPRKDHFHLKAVVVGVVSLVALYYGTGYRIPLFVCAALGGGVAIWFYRRLAEEIIDVERGTLVGLMVGLLGVAIVMIVFALIAGGLNGVDRVDGLDYLLGGLGGVFGAGISSLATGGGKLQKSYIRPLVGKLRPQRAVDSEEVAVDDLFPPEKVVWPSIARSLYLLSGAAFIGLILSVIGYAVVGSMKLPSMFLIIPILLSMEAVAITGLLALVGYALTTAFLPWKPEFAGPRLKAGFLALLSLGISWGFYEFMVY